MIGGKTLTGLEIDFQLAQQVRSGEDIFGYIWIYLVGGLLCAVKGCCRTNATASEGFPAIFIKQDGYEAVWALVCALNREGFWATFSIGTLDFDLDVVTSHGNFSTGPLGITS